MSEYPTSYNPPSKGDVLSTPYVAIKGGIYDDLKVNLLSISSGNEGYAINEAGAKVEGLIAPLLQLLTSTMNSEKAKEDNFLQHFSATMPDSQLKNQVLDFIDNGKFSLAYDAIQHWKDGLYNALDSYETNIDNYNKWVQKYRNKVVNQAIEDLQDYGAAALTNISLDTPLSAIPDLIINRMAQNSSLSNNEIQQYTEILQKALGDLSSNFTTGQWNIPSVDTTLRDIQTMIDEGKANSNIKGKFKNELWKSGVKSGYNKKDRSIMDACLSYISGFTNGLTMEVFLEIFGGGESSGRFMTEIKSLTGKNNSIGAMETDVFSIYNASFNYIIPQFNTLENNTEEDIRNKLNEIVPDDGFIIHYSVKDYTDGKIKIKGSGNFDVRLENIQTLNKVVGIKEIEQLIFAIANGASDMVMGGNAEEIKGCISAMCYAYMFEDMDNFVSIEVDPPKVSQTGPTHLHIYFVNGHYITASDLLRKTIDTIKESLLKFRNKKKWEGGLVSSPSLTLPPEGIYTSVTNQGKHHGLDKWEAVRQISLSKGKFDVHLSFSKLNEIITIKY